MSGAPPPRNLEGLLKFCVENTTSEDTTSNSNNREMSEERKEWLQNAIEEYINNNETLVIKRCLEVLAMADGALSPSEEEDIMTRETTLEQLEAVVDVIDNANDCYNLGGFPILLRYLDHNVASLQWRAAAVLGLCFQNNTYSQDQALKLDILPKLLQLIHSQSSDELVNIKSMFALAGLVRAHDEAEKMFIAHDGLSHLLRALERNISKLTTKTIFLLMSLIKNKNDYIDPLLTMGIVPQLITVVQSAHAPHHEYALNILLEMITRSPQALQDCRRGKYSLRSTLTSRQDYLKNEDVEAHAEELELCGKLLKVCFDEPSTDSCEAMDR